MLGTKFVEKISRITAIAVAICLVMTCDITYAASGELMQKEPVWDHNGTELPESGNAAVETDAQNPDTETGSPDADAQNPDTGTGNPDADAQNPDTDPGNPGTDVSPDTGTDPENPDTETENPDTDAQNPDTDPGNPGTDADPDTDPANPDPDNSGGSGDGDTEDDDSMDTEDDGAQEQKPDRPVLCVASRPDGRIKISWDKTERAAEYELFRSTKKDGGFRKIYQTEKVRHYTDEKCVTGQVYYYRLSAYTKHRTKHSESRIRKGRSLENTELASVSNLSGSKKLELRWKRVRGASFYQIRRKEKNGKYAIVATVKGKQTSYTDKGREGGKIYTYKVRATDADGGWGSWSNASGQMAIDAGRRMIALTYDDGPSLYTPIVLDALEKYEAHATFFVVGNRVNQYGGSIRREAELGCEIGNHTYGHNNLGSLPASQIQQALLQTNSLVKKLSGTDIHVMRPPGGSYNATVCAAAGMPVIMWSVDTLDWKTRNTAQTIQCVGKNAYDGAVVLMHDLHKPTADAADAVMNNLRSAGYQMVTISELAYYRGGMLAGKVYSQFRN